MLKLIKTVLVFILEGRSSSKHRSSSSRHRKSTRLTDHNFDTVHWRSDDFLERDIADKVRTMTLLLTLAHKFHIYLTNFDTVHWRSDDFLERDPLSTNSFFLIFYLLDHLYPTSELLLIYHSQSAIYTTPCKYWNYL